MLVGGVDTVGCGDSCGARTSVIERHLPAAPALSHGFGGEGVAMVLDISVVASRYDIDWIQIDLSRD